MSERDILNVGDGILTGPSNYTPDSQLILGASRQISGLFVATGCNGSGITFSGGVGRLLAEWVTGDAGFLDPAPFAPDRAGKFDPFSPAILRNSALKKNIWLNATPWSNTHDLTTRSRYFRLGGNHR